MPHTCQKAIRYPGWQLLLLLGLIVAPGVLAQEPDSAGILAGAGRVAHRSVASAERIRVELSDSPAPEFDSSPANPTPSAAVGETLTVSATPPILEVQPQNLHFTGILGPSNPPPQPVIIRNIGGGTMNWSVSEDLIWLSVRPRQGTTTTEADTLFVTASISQGVVGTFSGTLTIDSDGGVQPVAITFEVIALPDLKVILARTELVDCFSDDYSLAADFRIENSGFDNSAGTVARLMVNDSLRQQVRVPSLAAGESFDPGFGAQSLRQGLNHIECVVESNPAITEMAESNNRLRVEEWVPQRGDANLDSLINLVDLYRIVDLILERETNSSPKARWAANIAVDSTLNIVDVVALIDRLLENDAAGEFALTAVLEVQIQNRPGSGARLVWNSTQAISAWQATFRWEGKKSGEALQSVTDDNLAAYWKTRGDELRLLVWAPEHKDMQAGVKYAIALPGIDDLRLQGPATGLTPHGEIVKLNLHPPAQSAEVPGTFRLSFPYPNPLDRSRAAVVQWRYALPQASAVVLRILNLVGQEVRRIELGVQPAGPGVLSWDGKGTGGLEVANGIYFLEFKAGKFSGRQRIILR